MAESKYSAAEIAGFIELDRGARRIILSHMRESPIYLRGSLEKEKRFYDERVPQDVRDAADTDLWFEEEIMKLQGPYFLGSKAIFSAEQIHEKMRERQQKLESMRAQSSR